jgi:hypothetical protein
MAFRIKWVKAVIVANQVYGGIVIIQDYLIHQMPLIHQNPVPLNVWWQGIQILSLFSLIKYLCFMLITLLARTPTAKRGAHAFKHQLVSI